MSLRQIDASASTRIAEPQPPLLSLVSATVATISPTESNSGSLDGLEVGCIARRAQWAPAMFRIIVSYQVQSTIFALLHLLLQHVPRIDEMFRFSNKEAVERYCFHPAVLKYEHFRRNGAAILAKQVMCICES